ncbi:MAG: hypothetical protein WKF87_17190 [Chryseolinea sp.]
MKRISTYEELVVERKKLEADLIIQKGYFKEQINSVKEKFEPVTRIISFFGGFKSNTGNSLLKLGSSVGIDMLIGKKLKTASWLTRMVVPFVMKLTAQKTIDKVKGSPARVKSEQ